MTERTTRPATERLPAGLLLERLGTPTIAIGLDGVVVYANSACEKMLGYQTADSLKGQPLTALLIGHSHSAPEDCVDLLRERNAITKWNHSDGYPIAVVVSNSMLLRGTDTRLMVTLTDVTESVWSGGNGAKRVSPNGR